MGAWVRPMWPDRSCRVLYVNAWTQNLFSLVCRKSLKDLLFCCFAIKLSGGTRKTPIFMKFGLDIKVNGTNVYLESQVSNPFIIITNECQYEESEGLLLKKIAFKEHFCSL